MTSTEIAIRSIWVDALQVDAVGLDDNFVDLGGDSISGTLCLNRIRAVFDIDVRLELLLVEAISLRDLAQRIETLASGSPPALQA